MPGKSGYLCHNNENTDSYFFHAEDRNEAVDAVAIEEVMEDTTSPEYQRKLEETRKVLDRLKRIEEEPLTEEDKQKFIAFLVAQLTI